MQFITRHSLEHARQLGRNVPSRTRQALSQSTRTAPARIRQLSSTASSTTSAGSFSLPSTLTIALGTALIGIGSYYVGSRNDGSASTKAASAATAAGEAAAAAGAAARAAEAAAAAAESISPTPVYGTPEDFNRAIKELKDSFEEHMVSTDPSNLFTHGFSPNVMHEGEWCPSLTLFAHPDADRRSEKHRRRAHRSRLPVLDNGCGEDREDRQQVSHAHCTVCWRDELGRPLHWREYLLHSPTVPKA